MNITEKKGYRWLQFQGYKDIVFRARLTPDFVVEGIKSFEVKLARNNTIYITKTQYNQLEKVEGELTILVFNAESDNPIAIIPFSQIKERPKFWNNIRIIGQHPHRYIGQFDDVTISKLASEAAKFGLSINGIANFIINKYFSEGQTKPAANAELPKTKYMGRQD